MHPSVLLAVAALPLLVGSFKMTECRNWKGVTEYICEKEGHEEDKIHIQSIASTEVALKVSKYTMDCGGNVNYRYYDESYKFKVGESLDILFEAAKAGTCKQLYVYECMQNDAPANCTQIVSTRPAGSAANNTISLCPPSKNIIMAIPILPSRDGASNTYI